MPINFKENVEYNNHYLYMLLVQIPTGYLLISNIYASRELKILHPVYANLAVDITNILITFTKQIIKNYQAKEGRRCQNSRIPY